MSLIYINPYAFSIKDPNFANVSLLLHGNGSNGSTTITDNSPSPKTVTAVGNAQISTAFADPFGNSTRGVLAFDGTGDYLTAPLSISTFGADDFTIELWIYRNNSTPSGIVEARPSAIIGPWLWYINSASRLEFFTGTSYTSTATVSTLQWVNIAVTRSSSVLRQFINGVKVAENTVNTNLTTTAADVLIMRSRDAAVFNGYISNLRITKGVARYTANFTPPTSQFPDA